MIVMKKIIDLLNIAYPNAKCSLFYNTPYQLILSVILSAQAKDETVNKCMKSIYEKGFDEMDLMNLGEDKFKECIKTIGLYNNKASNIYKLTQILISKYNCQIPKDINILKQLPGIGQKTANVILGEVFNQATLAVDTHVMRVTKRLGLHDANNPNKIENILLKKINKKFLPKASHLFIEHGRNICKAKNPKCPICVLKRLCPNCK